MAKLAVIPEEGPQKPPATLRDVLYAIRFPSLSFNSLVQGRVFGRYRTNVERFAGVLANRGWSDYGGGGGGPVGGSRS